MSTVTDTQEQYTRTALGLGQDATGADIEREVHRIFRSTFSTPDGRKALNILLNKLCYYDWAKDDTQRALANFAQYFRVELLGANDTVLLTDALLDAAQRNA